MKLPLTGANLELWLLWRDSRDMSRVAEHLRLSRDEAEVVIEDFCRELRASLGSAHRDDGHKHAKVSLPPDFRLWRLAEFLSTKKTYASVFRPLLADFHHEYFESLRAGSKWKARWLRVLYFGAFFKSAGLNIGMKLLSEAVARFRKA